MIETFGEKFDDLFRYLAMDESFYLIEASLVIIIALVLDVFQRKSLKVLKEKAKRTKNIWDDIFLGALAKPVSIIIWISSVCYIADIIQNATKSMLFYELFDHGREVGIALCLIIFGIELIRKAEKNIFLSFILFFSF